MTELEMIRLDRIDFINKYLRPEGYLIAVKFRNGMKYLDLFNASGDCLKSLFAGSYKEMDLYISGMYNLLNLQSK